MGKKDHIKVGDEWIYVGAHPQGMDGSKVLPKTAARAVARANTPPPPSPAVLQASQVPQIVPVMIPMQSAQAIATPSPPQPIAKVGKAVASSKGVFASIIGCGKCCNRYRRKGCKCGCFPCMGPLVILAVLAYAPCTFDPKVRSAIAASAGLWEDLAHSAGMLAKSGSNITWAASDVLVTVSRSSMAVLAEAWGGVDITHAKANISAARWFMHRSISPIAFFGSPLGQQIVVTTDEVKEWLSTALDGTSPSLPSVMDSRIIFDVDGSYAEIQYEVRLFSSDLVGVRFLSVNMSFVPRWANPIWEIAGLATDRETDWVLQRIRGAVNTATEDMWVREPLSLKQISEVPVIALPWAQWLKWHAWR